MTNNNLDIGLYEIMPNSIKANSLDELKDEVGRLGNGWGVSSWRVNSYMYDMGENLGILDYIKSSYQYSFNTYIECVIDKGPYSIHVITDNPEEIKAFINGEYAVLTDQDGEDYDIKKSDEHIIDSTISDETFYICRPK